ncbi:MAG: short-chain dehydrogenase/reductase [Deltaproteobacteria bacterium]|nr:short-chain dehydrogenase/reductase [Deltaproteobacteria bacterium]
MLRVLITGSNSGIGRATAVHLGARGYEVFAGMRNLDKAERLLELAAEEKANVRPIELDVNSDNSVKKALGELLSNSGPVDVLINNAGIGMNATLEDVDIEKAKIVFDTNFWGIIRCTQAVLPAMREQGSGHVVNISSVAGRIAALAQVIYSSSKWAVECLSESLAQEVAPFGIRVSIIEPGVTRTAILPKNVGHPTPTVYETAYRRMLQFYAAGIAANVRAEEVAEVILGALENAEPTLRHSCAWGGEELCAGRARISDEEWVELGRHEEDSDYCAAFKDLFKLEIGPETR